MPAPEATAPRSEGVPTQTGNWVLFATILASSMAFIDGSALNVALPALQADLQARGTDLLWIVNAYALILAALLLVGGALGDRFGRKRVFMIGIALFASASLVCGLASSTGVLIGAAPSAAFPQAGCRVGDQFGHGTQHERGRICRAQVD